MILNFLRGTLLTLCGSFLVTQSVAQQSKPVYKSLLWEITGNGMTKPSYLYGTMHVSNKVAFHLTDTFYTAINSCDVVALEMNPDTWMDEMVKSETVNDAASLMREFGLYGGGVKNFYRKSVDIQVPDRKTIALTLADDPNLVNGMLYRFNDGSANYEEDTYLDLFIYQTAKKLKKRVSELENFEQSMEMAQKAMLPDEDSETRLYKKKGYMNAYELHEKIEDAYRKGDLDMLDSLSRESQYTKNYQKYLIDERNIIMANNMDSIMKKNTLFAAIGAAHLPADMGVINLLRQKGYTVRPIANRVSRKSVQMKTKLEKSRVPLNYSRQHTADSIFSVELPGRLYELPSFGEFKQYLYPEMMNGAYFYVSRVRTFSLLTGKNEEYIAKSIDSLLFESIPGKILKRESITSNSQYKGYNIMSRTRRGDVIRYNIFISPLEIFVFKMGGTGDFVKDEGDKFFSSIKFASPGAAVWKNYSPASGGYEVELPSIRLVETNKGSYKGERQDEVVQALDGDKGYYMVMRSSLHDFEYIEEDTFELGQIANEFRDQLSLKEISRKNGTFNGYPMMDVKMKGSNGYVHLRSIVRGPHYYTLVAQGAGENEPSKFFQSFRFKDAKYDKGFEIYKDTSLFFTVNSVVVPAKKSTFNDQNMYYLMNLYNNKNREKEDESYLPKKKKQNYYSASTAEAIHVKYEQFHKFYTTSDKQKFWDEKAKTLAGQPLFDIPYYGGAAYDYNFEDSYAYNPLVIKEKKLIEKDGLQEMHLVLTDTNSTRAIKARMILKGGVLYTVLATIDTISKPSAWVSTFFETFKPADTLIGQSPFEDRSKMFFEYLEGTDSTLRKQATKSLYVIDLKDKDAAALLKYMRTPAYKKLDLDTRASLINALGRLKSTEALTFLRAAYKEAADTATLQLAVLSALINQQTDKSYAAFIELFNIETPLTSNEYEASNLFYGMRDSMQLTKKLFPALLDFTRYPEYENDVYGVLATLVDSGYIDKAAYASSKASILKKANEELKRQLAYEEGGSNGDYEYDNYNPDYGYYGNYKLNNFSSLLIPFIQEPGVKAYFDKIARSKDDNLRISTFILLLKKNQPVHDSIWTRYSADEKTRTMLYDQLKLVKRLDKFDAKYKNQHDFVKAQLYNGYMDSLQFIEKRMVSNRNGQGYVYFFKSKSKDDKMWYLDYIGYMPADEKEVEMKFSLMDRVGPFDSETGIKEEIDSLMKQLPLVGRKRTGGQSLANYYQGLYGE